MNDLRESSNEEICHFLLNGKRGKMTQLGLDDENYKGPVNYINRVIYEDKKTKIIFSHLEIDRGSLIQKFFFYSSSWGRIKNSFFTLEGYQGTFDEKMCGFINIKDIADYVYKPKSIPNHKEERESLKKKDEKITIKVVDFASLVLYCKQKYEKSPVYVIEKGDFAGHNSRVVVRATMPDGKMYLAQGMNKENAADNFAVMYAAKFIR